MAKTIYEYATKSWPVVLGCGNSERCARDCWAKPQVHRKAHSKFAQVRKAHEGLVQVTDERERQIKGAPRLVWTGEIRVNEPHFLDPLGWKGSERVAVAYHGDLFRAPAKAITRAFAVMAVCYRHQFLVLTKQSERMLGWMPKSLECAADLLEGPAEQVMQEYGALINWPLPNVLLGVSIMSQCDADRHRGPMRELAEAGWNTWVSYGPALGPVDWSGWEFLRWLVCEGATGKDAPPMHPAWARASRDFCVKQRIPFFFKQWGEWLPIATPMQVGSTLLLRHDGTKLPASWNDVMESRGDVWAVRRVGKRAAGRMLDGREWSELPEVPRG